MTLVGAIICLLGIAAAYMALAMPLERITIIGQITIRKMYISAALFALAALLLIVGGAIVAVKNEARGHNNIKKFLSKIGVNRRPPDGRD
jgi:hypothetical protein